MLERRRNKEKAKIVAIDSTTLNAPDEVWYLISEVWLAKWRSFINNQGAATGKSKRLLIEYPCQTGQTDSRGFLCSCADGTGRGVLPPGPVDNSRLLSKDGTPLKNLRGSTHYRGVNKHVSLTFCEHCS
jgi:hypothetical protein